MSRRQKSSRLRQELSAAQKKHTLLVQSLIAERGPVIRGVFKRHGTRCGKPNCKCIRGELHPTTVLAVREDGKQRTLYVRPRDREEVQRKCARYRCFRNNRTEIAKLNTEILNLAGELLETLFEPYKPLPKKSRGSKVAKKKGAV